MAWANLIWTDSKQQEFQSKMSSTRYAHDLMGQVVRLQDQVKEIQHIVKLQVSHLGCALEHALTPALSGPRPASQPWRQRSYGRDQRGEQPLQVNAHLIGFCFDQCVDPIWCHSRLMRLNRVSAVNNYEVPAHTLPSMLTYPVRRRCKHSQ